MKRLIAALCLAAAPALAEKVNLGKIDPAPFLERYAGFENTFNNAFIGIPAGLTGGEPFYGTLAEAREAGALEGLSAATPTVLYMQGSGSFSKGPTFREWISGEGGMVFFAPNTHEGEGRPTYSSPVPKDVYESVHAYRQAEIAYALSRLDDLPFIDRDRMFLMGNSEGALAAARYAGKEFKGRLVLSWTCEPGYYTDYPKIGASYSKDPFLNIVGRDDAYFGKFSHFNRGYGNEGHCGDALFRFKHAKVVLLPNTGHNVMANEYTKAEVLDFLSRWSAAE